MYPENGFTVKLSQQVWIAIYLPGLICMKKMSKVGSWWLRNHRALDLELRLNKKDLWVDSHKYWNYVFMHFTISDFESTTSSASYWIKCFSNTFIVFTTKLARLAKLGRDSRQKRALPDGVLWFENKLTVPWKFSIGVIG